MEKPRELDKKEIYRYLGYHADTHVITPEIEKLVEDAVRTVLDIMNPKAICSPPVTIQYQNGGMCAASVPLTGKDMEKHLSGCHHVVFLAATLGTQLDTLIRKAEAVNMARAVALDAAANAAIEKIAGQAENELRGQFQKQHQYITGRYSPGYGDFPISVQKDVLRITDAPRKIGLTVTESHIMIPRKSVTAVLGVADVPVKGHLAGCATCVMRSKCIFRKRGTTCAISNENG